MELDRDTAFQFTIEVLSAYLRKPETESILQPIYEKYGMADQDRSTLLSHFHSIAPFVRLFAHYRQPIEYDFQAQREIVAESIRQLRQVQSDLYKIEQVTRTMIAKTQPLPTFPKDKP